MQQLFAVVNDLLRSDSSTRGRGLQLRTYRVSKPRLLGCVWDWSAHVTHSAGWHQVVPLTPQAGVMEFVDQTVALGGYLNDAHRRSVSVGLVVSGGSNLMSDACCCVFVVAG